MRRFVTHAFAAALLAATAAPVPVPAQDAGPRLGPLNPQGSTSSAPMAAPPRPEPGMRPPPHQNPYERDGVIGNWMVSTLQMWVKPDSIRVASKDVTIGNKTYTMAGGLTVSITNDRTFSVNFAVVGGGPELSGYPVVVRFDGKEILRLPGSGASVMINDKLGPDLVVLAEAQQGNAVIVVNGQETVIWDAALDGARPAMFRMRQWALAADRQQPVPNTNPCLGFGGTPQSCGTQTK